MGSEGEPAVTSSWQMLDKPQFRQEIATKLDDVVKMTAKKRNVVSANN